MIDITDKRATMRRAVAEARVKISSATADAIRADEVPKGSVVDVTRAAALLGIKRTPDLLPFCHPIPVDHAGVTMDLEEDAVRITVEVAAIARTGVEVEAMTGASIAALNVYDMVKPIDPGASITGVRLVKKKGGKSDHAESFDRELTAGVLVVSDSVAAGTKQDSAGRGVAGLLEDHGISVVATEVVPDEPEDIRKMVIGWADDEKLDFAFVVGGTGLGPRDTTPEAVRPLLEREIPGLAETVRAFGRERTPLADLSRAVGGQRGTTIIMAVAGSTRGARESVQALMPWLRHVLKVFDIAYRHGR